MTVLGNREMSNFLDKDALFFSPSSLGEVLAISAA
jgi:hypothetical protein